MSLSIDNMEETNVNNLQKGSIAENTELSAEDKDADPTDIEGKDTTVGLSKDQASTPAEASETPPNNKAKGHLKGQLEATLPDYSTREEPMRDTKAEALVRPSEDQASETPPNNEAGEQLTNHPEAVLTGGVPEAEATPENEQDVISPSEDQASTLETVQEANLSAEQGSKDNNNEDHASTLETVKEAEAVLPGGIQEAEATQENEQDAIASLEDQGLTLQTVEEPNFIADGGPNEITNELAAEENRMSNVAEEEPTLESPEKAGSEPIAGPTDNCVNKLGRKVPRKQWLATGRKFGAGKQLVRKRIVESSSS